MKYLPRHIKVLVIIGVVMCFIGTAIFTGVAVSMFMYNDNIATRPHYEKRYEDLPDGAVVV